MPLPRRPPLSFDDPLVIGKRKCKNCGKWFPFTERTKHNKAFCDSECKDEYNRFGKSFAPLKKRLLAEIAKNGKVEVRAAMEQFIAGRQFKRAMVAAGFIHRNKLVRKDPKYRAAYLAGRIEKLTREFNQLLVAVTFLQGQVSPIDMWFKMLQAAEAEGTLQAPRGCSVIEAATGADSESALPTL